MDALIDLEAVLPVGLIRTHCKVDDIPTVTNDQLVLYRAASFEAVEQYTGRTWLGTKYLTQDVHTNRPERRRGRGGIGYREGYSNGSPFAYPSAVRIRLLEATTDGVIVLTGMGQSKTVITSPGARMVEIPVLHTAVDVGDCDTGCAGGGNYGMTIRYKVGTCEPAQIPAGIKMGMLKYIAWAVENPGDRLMTVADTRTLQQGALAGTNNGVWASGALEQWRQYRTDIVQ